MFEPSWHLVYVRAESRTLRYFTPVYVRAESRTLRYFTPCLCSSLPDTMFTFERSRELFVRQAESRTFLTPCSCSSGVENPALLVYVRAFLTPCLRSSGVENPTLLDTLFMFERSRELFATWHLVYVRTFITPCLRSSGVENPFRQAGGVENPTLLYSLFMFEPYWHHVYVRAESRTPFRIVTLRTISYLNNEYHFYISKALLIYPSSDRLELVFLLCSIF